MHSAPPWAGRLLSFLVASGLTLTACGASQDAEPSKLSVLTSAAGTGAAAAPRPHPPLARRLRSRHL